jgi:cytidine deaminase
MLNNTRIVDMNELTELMQFKRLGYSDNEIKYKLNDDITFKHSAGIYIGNLNKLRLIAIGENKMKYQNILHAEMDVINKLPYRKNKKPLHINIIVIRTTKKFILGNSYPCALCIKYLYDMAKKKGYIIDIISYSNSIGEIESMRFIEIIYNDKQKFSSYYRNNNINRDKFMKWRINL